MDLAHSVRRMTVHCGVKAAGVVAGYSHAHHHYRSIKATGHQMDPYATHTNCWIRQVHSAFSTQHRYQSTNPPSRIWAKSIHTVYLESSLIAYCHGKFLTYCTVLDAFDTFIHRNLLNIANVPALR
jgi:hypothetical protein